MWVGSEHAAHSSSRVVVLRIERPAPTLGQHTNEVLRELLGVPDDELARLEQEGVTGTSMPEGSLGDAMSRMAVVKRTN